jgi:large subunit ribosomal protein L22
MNKGASSPVLQLVRSAAANAKNEYNLEKDQLVVKKIIANQGPTLQRFMPRAFGRATPLRKRTTHILLELGLQEGVKEEEIKKVDHSNIKAPTKVEGIREHEKEVEKLEKEKEEKAEIEEKKETVEGEEPISKESKQNVTKTGPEQKQQKKGSNKSFMNKVFNRKVG